MVILWVISIFISLYFTLVFNAYFDYILWDPNGSMKHNHIFKTVMDIQKLTRGAGSSMFLLLCAVSNMPYHIRFEEKNKELWIRTKKVLHHDKRQVNILFCISATKLTCKEP